MSRSAIANEHGRDRIRGPLTIVSKGSTLSPLEPWLARSCSACLKAAVCPPRCSDCGAARGVRRGGITILKNPLRRLRRAGTPPGLSQDDARRRDFLIRSLRELTSEMRDDVRARNVLQLSEWYAAISADRHYWLEERRLPLRFRMLFYWLWLERHDVEVAAGLILCLPTIVAVLAMMLGIGAGTGGAGVIVLLVLIPLGAALLSFGTSRFGGALLRAIWRRGPGFTGHLLCQACGRPAVSQQQRFMAVNNGLPGDRRLVTTYVHENGDAHDVHRAVVNTDAEVRYE